MEIDTNILPNKLYWYRVGLFSPWQASIPFSYNNNFYLPCVKKLRSSSIFQNIKVIFHLWIQRRHKSGFNYFSNIIIYLSVNKKPPRPTLKFCLVFGWQFTPQNISPRTNLEWGHTEITFINPFLSSSILQNNFCKWKCSIGYSEFPNFRYHLLN